MPVVLGELAGVIPPDLADLRPEDLRVEAEFFENLTRVPAPTPTPAPQPPEIVDPTAWSIMESLGSTISTGSVVSPAMFPPPVETPSRPTPPEPAPVPPPPPEREPVPAEKARVPEAASSIVPPIEIEPPSILPPGTELRRVSEVVLPASVVLAWSLFVLAGIALSFVAGLMIGHFLWKIH
jgi:hypothetical protein